MQSPERPSDFVVQIHSALAVRYGRRWLAMWAGLDMELVRSDWRRVLRDYAQNPAAVMHALNNLPETVPTAIDFERLCASGPRPAWKPLPPPATSEQGRKVMRDLLSRLRAPGSQAGPKGWAREIEAKLARGEPVSMAARESAAAALGRRLAVGVAGHGEVGSP